MVRGTHGDTGAATVGDFIRRQLTFDLGDCVGAISCPTLITEGEGTPAAQGDVLYDRLPSGIRKAIKRFSEAEGAGGHCEGLGATLFEVLPSTGWTTCSGVPSGR